MAGSEVLLLLLIGSELVLMVAVGAIVLEVVLGTKDVVVNSMLLLEVEELIIADMEVVAALEVTSEVGTGEDDVFVAVSAAVVLLGFIPDEVVELGCAVVVGTIVLDVFTSVDVFEAVVVIPSVVVVASAEVDLLLLLLLLLSMDDDVVTLVAVVTCFDVVVLADPFSVVVAAAVIVGSLVVVGAAFIVVIAISVVVLSVDDI